MKKLIVKLALLCSTIMGLQSLSAYSLTNGIDLLLQGGVIDYSINGASDKTKNPDGYFYGGELLLPLASAPMDIVSFVIGPRYDVQKMSVTDQILPNVSVPSMKQTITSQMLGGEAGIRLRALKIVNFYATGFVQTDIKGNINLHSPSYPVDFDAKLKNHYDYGGSLKAIISFLPFIGVGGFIDYGSGSYSTDAGQWSMPKTGVTTTIQDRTFNYNVSRAGAILAILF